MKRNRSVVIFLIIIIVAELGFKVYIDSHKEDFFLDELYSYGLMNYKTAYLFDEESFRENWHDSAYFDEYLIINEAEKGDWKPIYNNQAEDYHPPLYYLLLRVAASFTVGKFTKWTGLILNLCIFVLAAITVYFIGKEIFKSKIYALLLVAVYGFSRFSAENTLFIRMYQLLELNILLLAYWAVKNYYNRKVKILDMLSLIAITVLGTLTQYYFIFFYLGVFIAEIIRYIRKKQIKNLVKFILTFIISEILVYLIWPPYFEQLTRGSGRNETGGNTFVEKILSFSSRQKEYFEILDNNMFNLKVSYLFVFVILVGIIVLTVKLIKNRKSKVCFNKKINMLLVPTLIYWYIVTKTSQFIALRYILPIFVIVMIILVYLLKRELAFLIKNKKHALIATTAIMIIFLVMPTTKALEYQYPESKEKIENLEKYKDIPCIYMYTHKNVLENRFTLNLNYVRKLDNVYIMNSMLFTTQELKKALQNVDISKGILVFDNTTKIEKRVNKIITELDEFSSYRKIETFTADRVYPDDVYLVY